MGKAEDEAAKAEQEKEQGKAERSGGKRVEVLVDNLGPDLLKKGTITARKEIVALLDDPRGLVREYN